MVGPIVGTGARIAGNIGMRIITSEGAILGKAWWGFKKRREIVAGIRTGLGLGAGIGSFINDGSTPFDDNGIPEKSRYVSKANKFRQKYNRRSISRRNRCRCHRRSTSYRR